MSLGLLEGADLTSCAKVSAQLSQWLFLCQGAARVTCAFLGSCLAFWPFQTQMGDLCGPGRGRRGVPSSLSSVTSHDTSNYEIMCKQETSGVLDGNWKLSVCDAWPGEDRQRDLSSVGRWAEQKANRSDGVCRKGQLDTGLAVSSCACTGWWTAQCASTDKRLHRL